jgi:hypothetical protein
MGFNSGFKKLILLREGNTSVAGRYLHSLQCPSCSLQYAWFVFHALHLGRSVVGGTVCCCWLNLDLALRIPIMINYSKIGSKVNKRVFVNSKPN